ncbi:uncharacterized protein LOC106359004 [Brassica napus]|uniref:uncharacterized protein LOC106359004 n=1 Tax=Brassica napus TaxID=3708 RepID=UPI00207A75DC|nr:uncharacterized protein LOC106359004 [Brassica napus]
MNPASLTTGEDPPPLLLPPDPPDPTSSLSPVQFPPLGTKPPKLPLPPKTLSSPKSGNPAPSTTETLLSQTILTRPLEFLSKAATSTTPSPTVGVENTGPNLEPMATVTSESLVPSPLEIETLTDKTLNSQNPNPKFTVLPPQNSSPLNTNKASTTNPKPVSTLVDVEMASPTPPVPTSTSNLSPVTPLQPNPPTLVERIRLSEDKTLQRLAPVSYSETGRPRVLIPDAVFQKGAELHKDFIICYYNGRAPPFTQIQSVFNHMWGKGKKLEIHNNPLNRTTIVRITSEYLRNKILEKSIWYVGDTMFHTALWSSTTSAQPPAMDSIKIWAHLTGVPLDLRHREGLSLVAGLVGDPKETDAFTLNLVSLSLSHVKVEVDLTKPLPSVVEFERQSGEVVEVLVSYPWLPPTCSHCKELGHIARNYLKLPVPPAAPPGKGKGSMRKPDKKETKEKSAPQVQYVAVKDHNTKKPLGEAESGSATVNLSSPRTPFSKDSQSIPLPMDTENSFSIPKSTTQTHIKELTLPHIMSSICPRWNYASNHQADDDGRVILIWRDPLSVSIISQSRQSVTCEIKIPGLPAFIYTVVYAANTSQERTDLWAELTHLHSVSDLDSKPWMMGGDFNQILHSTEQSVPFDYNNSSAMYQFRDTLLQVGLFDSRFQGPSFSWPNKQHALPIAKKLDRMLLNYASIQSFPHATSFFQAPMISDHSPCLTDLAFPLPKAGTQPFKFLNYLTKHPNFHQVVQDAWNQAGSLCMDIASSITRLSIGRDIPSRVYLKSKMALPATDRGKLLQTEVKNKLVKPRRSKYYLL